jgi:hypothetical protein
MQDIDFDLAGARKAGAKPAQLSSYFKSNFNLDFDFDGAYKAGATDNQILSYLNQSYSDLKKKRKFWSRFWSKIFPYTIKIHIKRRGS